MALTDLLQAIEQDAAGELVAARRDAQRERERILIAAEREASAYRAATVARAARVSRDEGAALRASARAAAARGHRDARERALDVVLDRARTDLLGSRRRPVHEARTASLLAGALGHVGAVQLVHCHRDDRALVQRLLDARGLAAVPVVADLGTACGVVLTGLGRRIDNTVETRLTAAWPQLRSELALAWESALESALESGMNRAEREARR